MHQGNKIWIYRVRWSYQGIEFIITPNRKY